MSIILTSILVLKKIIDFYDFKRNKIHYEREVRENEKILRDLTSFIEIKTKADYNYYIGEAKQQKNISFTQIMRYFINNHLSFSKKKLKKYFIKSDI